MADPPRRVRLGPRSALELVVVLLRQRARFARIGRKHLKELGETLFIEREPRRELPQDRAELLLQLEQSRGEEIRQRNLDVLQLLHVRDESPAFDGEDKVFRRRVVPSLIAARPLE